MTKPRAQDRTGIRKAKIQEFLRPSLTLVVSLFLIGATLLCFWQVRHFGFVNLDDDEYVTDNPRVKSGFTLNNVAWAFSTGHSANWHPLTWLSHMLDCEIYGLNPGGHHVTSLLFHLASTLLLFLLLKRMSGALWESGFVAALFALHPLHVESVAWVAERKDVLSSFFWMLTMWAYVRYAKGLTPNPFAVSGSALTQSSPSRWTSPSPHPSPTRGEGKQINGYLLVLLFFVLGLMSKPMLVTLPFVLLLLDYWPLRRIQPGQLKNGVLPLVKEKIPLFLLSAASSAVTFLVQQSGGAVGSFDVLPLRVRIANALVSYVSYIWKMIWPQHLAVYYPYVEMLPLWQVAGLALLLITITLWVIRLGRRCLYLPVGWFWYLATLAPVIGLVQVGGQSMADRYTYVPLIGLFIMIAMGVSDVLSRWRNGREVLAVSAGMTVAVLLVIARIQVSYWHDSVRLFEHTLASTSSNYLIHNNLGTALERKGRVEEAIDHYKETLRIRPHTPRTYFNMGNALARQGKVQEAMAHYVEALQMKPDYAEAHNNLGSVLDGQGRIEEAMSQYIEALRIRPDYAEAESNLGVALAKQGKVQEAMVHFEKAIRMDPQYEKAHHNLGVALSGQGKNREAIANYTEALRIKPTFVEARYSLGLAYAAIGDRTAALEQCKILSTINPDRANRLFGEISK